MRARSVPFAAIGLLAALSCHRASAPHGEPLIRLFDDVGHRRTPITTSSELTQRYFDQGLALTYAFNHDAAVRSFREAARLDPRCAACFWGVALALGPNINAPMGPDAEREAAAAVAQAQALAAEASPLERDLIEALAVRYSAQPDPAQRGALDRAYADKMREVHRLHPADADAATLFAESLMDLHPWQHWTPDGKPQQDTPEIVSTLEAVLAVEPSHPGANHYYIHAVEASPRPDRALPSAERLPGLAPGAGHLVHMPAHIFMRVGRYDAAADINDRAVRTDEAYFTWCRAQGLYAAMYYPHNIHFLWAAAAAEGRSDVALTAARRLVANVPPDQLAAYPFAEDFMPTPLFALLRFGRFDEILGEPAPPPNQLYTTAMWHYARGIAQLRRGDRAQAQAELAQVEAAARSRAMNELLFMGGSAAENLRIAAAHLRGEIAASRKDLAAAREAYAEAIRREDALAYTEPPPWYFPMRQAFGAVLLDSGRSAEAEQVYREDLRRNPRNGWSLFGLARSLSAQGKKAEATAVETGFRHAWARADVQLMSSRF
jgi:tetratricopeptide (TPR) repeat protein